ncbi:MAG: hypothetical protein NUV98_05970 [Candidatus Roizmanbacteria bacterium]|nr:hypothetical protein [Candidatus Roizmanbacteria bacterium]
MQKIQITLTDQEADILKTKAGKLGYKLPRYIKYLISNAVIKTFDKSTDFPTIDVGPNALRIADKAYEDYKAGKTKRIKSVKELLDL